MCFTEFQMYVTHVLHSSPIYIYRMFVIFQVLKFEKCRPEICSYRSKNKVYKIWALCDMINRTRSKLKVQRKCKKMQFLGIPARILTFQKSHLKFFCRIFIFNKKRIFIDFSCSQQFFFVKTKKNQIRITFCEKCSF